jgi:hypothetical protein
MSLYLLDNGSLGTSIQKIKELIATKEQLQRELAAERALADRLASALTDSATWNHAMPAYGAWKEARNDT